MRVRITGIDELTLDVHASLVARLDEATPADQGDSEGTEDDEVLDNAGPLTLAIDVKDADAPAPYRLILTPPHPCCKTLSRTALSKLTLLHKTLLISVGIHAAAGFRFVDPEGFNRTFKDTPLEVILVNSGATRARQTRRPWRSRTWLAGRVGQENERATSPSKPSDETEVAMRWSKPPA